MTSVLLLSILCQWINSITDGNGNHPYKAIQGPSNNPAPAGRYISVVAQNTRQVGDVMVPGPKKNASDVKYKTVMQVTNVQFYEVEGDGEWLRDLKNRMQLDEFGEFVAQHVVAEQGKDNGFSVWEIGEIVDNGFQDGPYYIQQRTMTADFQFYDHIVQTTERMAGVSGNINNEPFFVEEQTNG